MQLYRAQGATQLSSLRSATYCPMLGQGAIESSLLRSSTAGTLLAQGATEYLVLLAVVLIVALVSVALLGFFPGMASDAQMTQSQTYWKSASPISITEFGAMIDWFGNYSDVPYLRIRNTGQYPIRITKVLSGTSSVTTFYCGGGCPTPYPSISDYFYFSPGEERFFGGSYSFPGLVGERDIFVDHSLLASHCQVLSSSTPGTFVANNFGFEYIEYLEGQQITKRQMGTAPLRIKCSTQLHGG